MSQQTSLVLFYQLHLIVASISNMQHNFRHLEILIRKQNTHKSLYNNFQVGDGKNTLNSRIYVCVNIRRIKIKTRELIHQKNRLLTPDTNKHDLRHEDDTLISGCSLVNPELRMRFKIKINIYQFILCRLAIIRNNSNPQHVIDSGL